MLHRWYDGTDQGDKRKSNLYLSEIWGIEINKGKTKIIRIGTRLDDLEPTTNEKAFKYAKNFTLLGVNIR